MDQLNKERGVEMTKHEEARVLLNELVPLDEITPSQIDDLREYITSCEADEKKYEELNHDVKRYLYLKSLPNEELDGYIADEYLALQNKLQKAGESK